MEVAGKQKRRRTKKKKIAYLLGRPVVLAHVLTLLEPREDLLNRRLLRLPLLHLQRLAALAGLLLLVLERLLDKLNILEPQLLADDVQVAGRVDVTFDVDDLGIVKTPHHLEDGIDGANVRQEGVAETRASGGTAGQTGNVVDCEVGRHPRLGVVLFAQPVIAGVGDDDASFLGVNRRIGKVLATISAIAALARGISKND